MSNPLLKKVVIDGVDVSDYVISFEIPKRLSDSFSTAAVFLRNNVEDVLAYDDTSLVGTSIVISRGVTVATEEYLFRGYVRKIEFVSGKVKVGAEDKLSQCKYIVVNDVYDANIDTEAGVISEILETLLTQNTTLSYTASTIQNSGTVNIISQFVLRRRILMDALFELAYALNWSLYYNSQDDYVYFEPKGYTRSTTLLTVGDNIVTLPKWNIDSSQQFNEITVRGTSQELLVDEGPYQLNGAHANWDTTSLTLDNKPVTVQVFIDSSNPPTTEKRGGVIDSSSTYDYSVNKEQALIEFSDTFTPTATWYATVRYTYTLAVQVTRSNQSSKDAYGIKATSQFREDIKTVEDARSWAASQLEIYSFPFYSTNIAVKGEQNLRLGAVYNVVDEIQGVSQWLLVQEIKYSYPYRFDELAVADQEYRSANWAADIPQRVRRLEEKQASNEDLVNIGFDFDDESTGWTRDFKASRRTLIGGGFIIGHPIYGIIGPGSHIGPDSAGAASVIYLAPGNNTFKEYVIDSDYVGTLNDTTWDTSAKTITVNSTFISSKIALGHAFTKARVYVSSTSDEPTLRISADGQATWQLMALNSLTTLTSSDGTGIYYKIDAGGTQFGAGAGLPFPIALGGATVLRTVLENNKIREPALTIELS